MARNDLSRKQAAAVRPDLPVPPIHIFEKILKFLPIDLVIFDPQGRFIYISENAIRDPELNRWLIGKTEMDYFVRRNRALDIPKRRMEAFLKAVETRQAVVYEEELPWGEKKQNKLRAFHPMLDDGGELSFVVGYGYDITTVRESEAVIEKQKIAIEQAQDGIALLDAEGRYYYMNRQHEQLFGYAEGELIGQTWKAIYEESEARRIEEDLFPQLMARGKWTGETAGKTKSGQRLIQEITLTPLPDGGLLCICRDISHRLQIEHDLIAARDAAEASMRAKRRFLANMSHEIRTPMNAVLGLTEQLLKTRLDEQQCFYASTIQTAANNLLNIINDVLYLSKFEEGQMQIEHIPMNISDVLTRLMDVIAHKAEEKGISLRLGLHSSLKKEVLGDPYRLNQILLNIVGNAIKFTEHGSVTIGCERIERADARKWVRFIVEDTGIGMEEEVLKIVFDYFRQEDESFVRRFGGTGLGLTISKTLVELMEGTIELESIKGKGTKVTIDIPFTMTEENSLSEQPAPVVVPAIPAACSVLLAEDNKLNSLLASIILKNAGVAVTLAENGQEAVEQMRAGTYDLVLMDIQMPVMDGVQATQVIRTELGLATPIIALTAHALREEKEIYLRSGMNDFLTKPFTEEQLIQLLSKWVKKNANS